MPSSGSPSTIAEAPAPALASRPTGHQRMVDTLRQIQVRTPDENRYLGDRFARQFRTELEALGPTGSDVDRWRLNRLLGVQELNMGNARAAIQHLTNAYRLLPKVEREIGGQHAADTVFRLAVAYIRLGEIENCCDRPNAESCILPLSPAAVHGRLEGSQKAIPILTEILQKTRQDSELNYKCRWLLNVAHMTLGSYPDKVPAPYRVPAKALQSSIEFPRFRNVAPSLKLDSFNLSGGVVIDDLDGDNDFDILTSTWSTSGQIQLFINETDGRFVERHRDAGLEGIFGGLNLVHADYDNDGDLDVLVLRGAWLGPQGRYPNSLLQNDGRGMFTDVTFDAGLGAVHYPTQTAAWADYDNDGDVDLFVGNESVDRFQFPCQLFKNNGDGTFTDVAEAAGVQHFGFVKGVAWGDYDGDRFPDLCLSVYEAPNKLYHNNGDGTFTDVAQSAGVAEPHPSFPAWFWDFDNDGHLDLFISSYTGKPAEIYAHYAGLSVPVVPPGLFHNRGDGKFQNVAAERNLHVPMRPMGANCGDLDGDGFPDMYLGTGDPDFASIVPNLMFLNRGGRFVDVTMAGGFGHLQKGHGIAFADIDNDGDNDVFEQMGGAYAGDGFADALYENPGFGNRWLRVKLVGTTSNRAAIGARVRVTLREGENVRSVFWTIGSGGSFGANPMQPTLGLGQASKIQALEVFWPTTGKTQTLPPPPLDTAIEIREDATGWQPLAVVRFALSGTR